MATSYKAIEMAAEMADKIKARNAGTTDNLAVTSTFDSNGNPVIQIGTGVAGSAGCVIRIEPISWPLAKDILGLSSQVYTPHVAQLITEAAAANDLGLTSWADLGPILTELFGLGTRVEVYVAANGTGMSTVAAAPDTYAIAANLRASIEHDVYKMMLSSQ